MGACGKVGAFGEMEAGGEVWERDAFGEGGIGDTFEEREKGVGEEEGDSSGMGAFGEIVPWGVRVGRMHYHRAGVPTCHRNQRFECSWFISVPQKNFSPTYSIST